MKLPGKFLLIITIIFAATNILIFIYRNKGFEYRKFSSHTELYPPDPGNSFQDKWKKANIQFSSVELDLGLALLNQTIGTDTISNVESKIMYIAGWLYNSFCRQLGRPDDSLAKQTPLQQYYYLSIHKEKQLWCGNFQVMFGFFCTAAGLPSRYIEIVPRDNNMNFDYHEVNEVYLAGIKKWVMVDVTRNRLLIRKDHQLFSAAEYLDHRLQNHASELFFVRADTASAYKMLLLQEKNPADKYFNENHLLRYYYTMDLSKVYAFWPKIKRYFLADPWYEMYEPGKKHSNFLFRIKQFFLFGMVTVIIVMVVYKFRLKK
jgi:hypothetical protein